MSGMRDFLDAVAQRESGGNHRIINRAGFVGKYQFGEAALIDLGYYLSDGSNYKNDWKGKWTGKNGIHSLEEFRSSPDAQDMAGAKWFKILCKRARIMGLDKYYGRTIRNIKITESGVLAGMHLVGAGTKKKPAGVSVFLFSEGKNDPADGFGTTASDYIKLFSNFSLGCCTGQLDITLDEGKGSPISGLKYEVRSENKVIQKGATTEKGKISEKIVDIPFSQTVELWVERLQGGFKKIWSGMIQSSEHNIGLSSPKAKVTGTTKPHSGAAGGHSSRVEKARESGTHTVKRGDSLWAISRLYGLSVEELRALNPAFAHSDRITPGQILNIRGVVRPDAQKQTKSAKPIAGGASHPATANDKATRAPSTPTQSTSRERAKAAESAPTPSTRTARTEKGNPVTIAAAPATSESSHSDNVSRMIEILNMNVRWGDPKHKPDRSSAVKNAKNNIGISSTAKLPGKSLGRCYQYVKVALQASGMTTRYLEGAPAKLAGAELQAQGFHNLLAQKGHGVTSPYDAPTGSIIVYDVTDGSEWGHIEVRTDDGQFASDYKSPNSRVMRKNEPATLTGRKRKVIGIWVKK